MRVHMWTRVTAGVLLLLSMLAVRVGAAGVAHADDVTHVTVHYYRFAGDYGTMSDVNNSWNLWLWPYQPTAGNGQAYTFQGTDSFGAYANADVPGANTQVGIIVRYGNWAQKDVSNDRFIDTPGQKAEVWLIQGDPTIYYSLSDAEQAIANASKPRPLNAFLDGLTTAAVKLKNPVDLSQLHASDFVVQDKDSGATYTATAFADLSSGATTGLSSLIKVTFGTEPDITHQLMLLFQDQVPIPLTPRLVLDDDKYYYGGSDLGATYTPASTTFRVWAPLATDVQLLLYNDESGNGEQKIAMTKSDHGTWVATVTGDEKNRYYLYQVTNFGKTATALDPYAHALAVNAKYGMVVDLSDANPSGWSSDAYHTIKHQTDASIYEVHVRDFSIDPSSGMQHRGKYLAFTERGTKTPAGKPSGIDYLKKLGVNYVQLQPIQQIQGLSDITGGTTDLKPANSVDYNWGYETQQFNTPDGAYATDPHGDSRITEVKQMVQAIHKEGMGVLMDVVYNHTADTNVFDPLVPGYYYRTDYSGNTLSASGAGPDIASEHRMVRKFIVDSVSYWTREYHVDGFRFDLMSLLGKDTMAAVAKAVRGIDPHAVLLGEPWNFGEPMTNGDTDFTQGTQQGMHIGMFNDFIRDVLHGRVFDKTQPGYATGDPNLMATPTYDANNNINGFNLSDGNNKASIATEIVGNIDYNAAIQGWAKNPDEIVNYVSSHDNQTWWDRIQSGSISGKLDHATQVSMDEFGEAIIFTSQGIPFMQGGDEFLRSKGGNDNSYNQGDVVNKFDWNLPDQNSAVVSYYAGLFHLRAAHPAFRMDSPATIGNHLVFLKSARNTQEFELKGHANKDKWKNIVVAMNPYDSAQTFKLPAGKWTVVGRSGQVGTKTLGHASKKVHVPAYTVDILHQ